MVHASLECQDVGRTVWKEESLAEFPVRVYVRTAESVDYLGKTVKKHSHAPIDCNTGESANFGQQGFWCLRREDVVDTARP